MNYNFCMMQTEAKKSKLKMVYFSYHHDKVALHISGLRTIMAYEQPNSKLAHQFAVYSEWRKALVDTICDYRAWLNEQELNDRQVDQRIQQFLDRLREDKLNVAFVAVCHPSLMGER